MQHSSQASHSIVGDTCLGLSYPASGRQWWVARQKQVREQSAAQVTSTHRSGFKSIPTQWQPKVVAADTSTRPSPHPMSNSVSLLVTCSMRRASSTHPCGVECSVLRGASMLALRVRVGISRLAPIELTYSIKTWYFSYSARQNLSPKRDPGSAGTE